MKNITPEWEVVLLGRYFADNIKALHKPGFAHYQEIARPNEVYLLHKGHVVYRVGIYVTDLYDAPYNCHHCREPIPMEWVMRYIKMRKFLILDT